MGYYLIDFIEIKNIVYAITYDPVETLGYITKLLVTKFVKEDDSSIMTNLEEADKENMVIIAEHFMSKNTVKYTN